MQPGQFSLPPDFLITVSFTAKALIMDVTNLEPKGCYSGYPDFAILQKFHH